MINFTIIIGSIIIFIGILYLILTKYKFYNNISEDDKELIILNNIIYKIKLKSRCKSIDKIIENLKKHNIKINFNGK